ncbi:MAG: chorismate mutase [Acholeplasmataceae bacterium]|jgi:monofunctional chorismate mutase|nr:chorismate mutase [Acholeplasmataceae bacterium]
MNLNELRKEIDDIDDAMMDLFIKRMSITKQIGKIKRSLNLPIYDPVREEAILERREKQFNDHMLWPSYRAFLLKLFELSKDIQKNE